MAVIDFEDINEGPLIQIPFESIYPGRETTPRIITIINNHPTEDRDVTLTAALGSLGSSLDTVDSTLLSDDDIDYVSTTKTVTVPADDYTLLLVKWHPPSTAKVGEKSWILNKSVAGVDELTGWTYTGYLTITNTGGELTNEPITFTVDYDPDYMNTDFGDLRFYQDDTECSYTIPYLVEGDSATFDVEIPTITATGDTVITVYSGNPSTTADESFVDVYAFYDLFTDNSIDSSIWGTVSGGGTSSIAETNQEIQVTSDGSNRAYLKSKTSLTAPYTVYFNAKVGVNVEVVVCWDGLVSGSYDAPKNGYFIYYNSSGTPQLELRKYSGGSSSTLDTYVITLDAIYHTFKVVVEDGLKVYYDNTLILESSDTTYTTGYLGFSASQTPSGVNAYYDNVYVRNAMDSDLTISEIGNWYDHTPITIQGGILYQPQDLPGYTPVPRFSCRVGGVLYE